MSDRCKHKLDPDECAICELEETRKRLGALLEEGECLMGDMFDGSYDDSDFRDELARARLFLSEGPTGVSV